MIGDLRIDGVDMYQEYGVFVHDGGYAGLVGYPPLKSVEFNDWPEEDGVDPDLSETHLDSKTFSMTFGGTQAPKSDGFINFLTDGAYHVFEFIPLGITRRLRMNSQSNRQTLRSLELFALQFSDDFPLSGYEYQEPVPNPAIPQKGYKIDGVALSDYGVWVTDGTDDEIEKSPIVKQNLLINVAGSNGLFYDGEEVVFQPKDVSIKCHIRADIETFWRNYNALLYDLSKPGERIFYYDKHTQEYPCYYKKSQVSRFSLIGGEAWCDFTITLSFISFRIGEVHYLLAAEDGALIVLEDGETYVDVQRYGNS